MLHGVNARRGDSEGVPHFTSPAQQGPCQEMLLMELVEGHPGAVSQPAISEQLTVPGELPLVTQDDG